jgi:amphi-Trp domain-containing protein
MTATFTRRERSPVTESNKEGRLSRRATAEQLVDLAYALTAGEIELSRDGERVTVQIADEVILSRTDARDRDRVEIQLTLSWPA